MKLNTTRVWLGALPAEWFGMRGVSSFRRELGPFYEAVQKQGCSSRNRAIRFRRAVDFAGVRDVDSHRVSLRVESRQPLAPDRRQLSRLE